MEMIFTLVQFAYCQLYLKDMTLLYFIVVRVTVDLWSVAEEHRQKYSLDGTLSYLDGVHSHMHTPSHLLAI